MRAVEGCVRGVVHLRAIMGTFWGTQQTKTIEVFPKHPMSGQDLRQVECDRGAQQPLNPSSDGREYTPGPPRHLSLRCLPRLSLINSSAPASAITASSVW